MRGLSTSAQRINWADPSGGCYKGPFAVVSLYGGAKVSVRPAIVPAVKALSAIFAKHG